jgi:hypothetical protein
MSKTYKKWSEAELNFIRENSNSMKDVELAVRLSQITGNTDISVAMVRRQRRKLNLAKTRGRRTNKVVTVQQESSDNQDQLS